VHPPASPAAVRALSISVMDKPCTIHGLARGCTPPLTKLGKGGGCTLRPVRDLYTSCPDWKWTRGGQWVDKVRRLSVWRP
jgi:hypothetical protein